MLLKKACDENLSVTVGRLLDTGEGARQFSPLLLLLLLLLLLSPDLHLTIATARARPERFEAKTAISPREELTHHDDNSRKCL